MKELFSITEPLVILMYESVDVEMDVPENVTLVKVPDNELTFCSEYMVNTLIELLK